MNSLSWLIYAAGVLDGLRAIMGIGLAVSLVAIAAAWIARMMAGSMVIDGDLPSERKPKGSYDYQKWSMWRSVTQRKSIYMIPFALMLALTVFPPSRTLWLIAASEAGEAVVTSPDAIEMMGDLKAIIKKRLKEELGE